MRLIAALLLLLVAAPVSAASRSCTAPLVSAGLCATQAQHLIAFSLPPAVAADLEAEVCDRYGYPLIVCSAADVAAGRCASGQLGQAATTSESRGAFANRMLGELLRNMVRDRRLRTAQDAARTAINEPGAID